jgi:hypothetical protein
LAVDQLMLSGTFVACRLNLTPAAVSKLVSRGRLETETREIAKELPEVNESSVRRRFQRVTRYQYRMFGNFSPTSQFFHHQKDQIFEESIVEFNGMCWKKRKRLSRKLQ